MHQFKGQIRDFIGKNILFSENGFPYGDDVSFLQQGIIDSLGVMDLVAFVESDLGVKVDPEDITPENFDSVDRLSAYVARKSALGAVSP
jgi:acyl carrier protein